MGRKTAACVLLFSSDRPELPVDTPVYRVASRLGLIRPRASFEEAHDVLGSDRPCGRVELHVVLIRHGRPLCSARAPAGLNARSGLPLWPARSSGVVVDGEQLNGGGRSTPCAVRNEVAGERDGVVLVRVTAPPEGGKANAGGVQADRPGARHRSQPGHGRSRRRLAAEVAEGGRASTRGA